MRNDSSTPKVLRIAYIELLNLIDLEFSLGTDTMFSSWRAFILISSIPVVLSIIGLFMMPESPRFLLQVG